MKKFLSMFLILVMVSSLMGGTDVTTVTAASGTVKKVEITAPTKKSTYTISRYNENVTIQTKVKVSVTGNASKKVTYASSNSKVASISSKGVITVKKAGTTTITVTSQANKKVKDTLKLTVKQRYVNRVEITAPTRRSSYTIIRSSKDVKVNTKVYVSASYGASKAVKYTSSKPSVATVSSKGVITAKKAGTTTITVTSAVNKKIKDTIKINVVQRTVKLSATTLATRINPKKTTKIVASFSPSTVSNKKLTYSSANTKVAKVDKYGKITGVKAGKTKIKVSTTDGSRKSVYVTITVTNDKLVTKMTISSAKKTIYVGDKTKVSVKVSPSYAKYKSYTLSSSNKKVLTVDSKGYVKGIGKGSAYVIAKAKDGSGITTKVKITVKTKPTPKPTAKPTVKPTAKPTVAPTAKPSVSPTAKPTVAPTVKPSVAPSQEPKKTYTKVSLPDSYTVKEDYTVNVANPLTITDGKALVQMIENYLYNNQSAFTSVIKLLTGVEGVTVESFIDAITVTNKGVTSSNYTFQNGKIMKGEVPLADVIGTTYVLQGDITVSVPAQLAGKTINKVDLIDSMLIASILAADAKNYLNVQMVIHNTADGDFDIKLEQVEKLGDDVIIKLICNGVPKEYKLTVDDEIYLYGDHTNDELLRILVERINVYFGLEVSLSKVTK